MMGWLNGGRSPKQQHKYGRSVRGGAIALLLTLLLGEGAIAAPIIRLLHSAESRQYSEVHDRAVHDREVHESSQVIYAQTIRRRDSRHDARRDREAEPLRRPPDAIPPRASDECITLTAMANIAYLWDLTDELSEEVEGRQVAACWGRETESRGIPQWSNRRTMRLGSRWSYPNGQSAQFSDYWNYPNGRSMNFGSSWYYPDGSTARFGSSWYTPDGRRVSEDELLAIACAEVGSRRCANRLDEVGNDNGFWYTLSLMQLAWLGEQIEQGRIDPD